ncbi:hypothetical protein [Plantactinospora sp. CA-290183]|uniref:hypothetical protein n=1 Tax=Plantactinospora sp. CA-290183 TaxID=3240006 RepID=UPI003D8B43F1
MSLRPPTPATPPGPVGSAEPAAGGGERTSGSPDPPAEGGGGSEPAQPLRRSARQLSLFGVEAADPAPADLAGLLAGPAELVRMGGTARVSMVVDAAWRVHVLVAELARRGLRASWLGRVEERHGVSTSYTTLLAPLAASWLRGTVKRPPLNFFLNGPRLRLWTAAAGGPEPLGFVLRLDPSDESGWEQVGAALAAIGLPAVLLDPGAGGPAYRITGRRRLARLAELVGDRPAAAPPSQWPAAPS